MFRVISADAPWPFKDKLTMSQVARGAEANYKLMSMTDIYNLGPLVQRVSEPDAVLVLWVPHSLLTEGLITMTSWGFRQTQVYTWVKTSSTGLAFGMGRLFRGASELALVGVRGSPYKFLRNKSQRNVSLAPNLGHSIKPDNLHESLDLMFEGPKLEMFARRSYPGWTCIGNELTGNDITVDLENLWKP